MRYLSAEIWLTPGATVKKYARSIDEEIHRIITECHDRAKEIILEHEDVLHSCAKLLLEKEKVHRDEFEALFTRENSVEENTKYIK